MELTVPSHTFDVNDMMAFMKEISSDGNVINLSQLCNISDTDAYRMLFILHSRGFMSCTSSISDCCWNQLLAA